MNIKKALICTETPKTDNELRAIVATHPWAPLMTHGFYRKNPESETWEDRESYSYGDSYGAIYVDAGIAYKLGSWLVESYHAPHPQHPCSRFLDDERFRQRFSLHKAWWKATSDLILNDIPDDYRVHVIYYAEITDEFDDTETVWRRNLLEYFNYAPELKAALGITETADA
ncbi:hypothetical protein HU230_0006390 [Bradyrhizobium quebecense]|uniref:Uncharacterized protein n=1 Tax=Bradyrhizobium quebecense TaxID=2748629 RepID=A0A974AET1_9BRAD|nr:hypothetical protein [Bradyrhizobium quebecense]UGA45664.1 hypothetical protein HU230_0006390 [Bradyrhizobium quebecense]